MASPLRLLKEAGLSRYNLVIFALLTAALNGIVTASIGAWLAQTYASHQSRRHAVQTLADIIYERQTRARLVLSSVRRGADVEEVRARKRAYDDAFVEWNKKVQGGVLAVREAMNASDTTVFETLVQTLLVPAMAEMDGCTTRVYDLRIAGKELTTELDNCQRQDLNHYILDCGGAITDELFRFTRLSFNPFQRTSGSELQLAKERAIAGCKRPVPSPSVNAAQPAPPTAQPTVLQPPPKAD